MCRLTSLIHQQFFQVPGRDICVERQFLPSGCFIDRKMEEGRRAVNCVPSWLNLSAEWPLLMDATVCFRKI